MTAQPTQKMIFVNLPVNDLQRAIAFYEGIGCKRDPRFSSEDTASMIISDTIIVMLMTRKRAAEFTSKTLTDAHTSAQLFLCMSASTRGEVDEVVAKAAASGGKIDVNAPDDYGFMYGRSFEDPDGHMWGVNWMDLAAFEAAQKQHSAA